MSLSTILEPHRANQSLKIAKISPCRTETFRAARQDDHGICDCAWSRKLLTKHVACYVIGAMLLDLMSSITHQQNGLMLSPLPSTLRWSVSEVVNPTRTPRSLDRMLPLTRSPQSKPSPCAQRSTARAVSFFDPNRTSTVSYGVDAQRKSLGWRMFRLAARKC